MRKLLLGLLVLVPSVSLAGHCRVRVSQRAVVISSAPLVLQQVYPSTYYSVGASLQEQALAERIAALVLQKLDAAASAEAQVQTEAQSEPQAEIQATAVSQRCATCHQEGKPGFEKSGLDFTSISSLSCEQKLQAVRAVLSGKMPKGGPALNPDEAGAILEELVAE